MVGVVLAVPFLQIIEFTTSDFGALQQLNTEWEKATDGKRSARRQIVTRDRKNPEHYQMLVFFDSYESAMENSKLPETQAFAQRYATFTNGVTFHDLDVVSDRPL